MRRALALLLCAVVAPSCAVGVRRAAPKPTPSRTVVPVSAPPCSTVYRPADPRRPRVALTFDVAPDHASVTGTEHVVFTPDRPVTEVVLRLWPNGPWQRREGARLEVTRASLPMTLADDGTTLVLALPAPSPAGRSVTVDLAFALTLPRASFDRLGHTERTAWFASAHPLLAWVRGEGWVRDPAADLLGETAVSEAAFYDVTVTAPAADTVLGVSLPDGPPEDAAGGVRRWHFVNAVARDVAVAAGPFATRQERVGTVPVLVAVSDELASGAAAETVLGPVLSTATNAVRFYADAFGPYPYPALTVVALKPIGKGGVEYPGLVYVGSQRYEGVVPHEVAHEWFYGLVGDDQARDPWLDEAFATFAAASFDNGYNRYLDDLDAKGDVGRPMSYWEHHRDDYGKVVYAKGAAALIAARDTVGAAAFDRRLRCYVAANAYRVATPAHLAAVLAPFPDAVRILTEAGALPR
ncbi:MAG TPA: M1 family aminopeptidase [Mycobacteriales bacterium]|jgi:aminopeptidase N|nr:M1 family aminopeptidase [Mycobacteriales bacterium]